MNHFKNAKHEFADRRQSHTHRFSRKVISVLGLFLMLVSGVFMQGRVGFAYAEIGEDGHAIHGHVTADEDDTGDEEQRDLAMSAKGFEIIILSSYKETMKIGQSKLIIAASTGGIDVTWKSSNAKVASVDMYGMVTAKKAGSCKIIAKTKGAEAKCSVVVEKTSITLNTKKVSIENGSTFQMRATTSSGSPVTWKSSKQSVAIIGDNGLVQAIKPGSTIITATADGAKETCTLTVMKPSIKLSTESVKLYRGQKTKLSAVVTSNREVTWKSSRPSVATVDEYGNVNAIKHGEARISARVDGVVRYCVVTVMSPTISLSKTSITLKKGETFDLKAKVSSGVTPTYTCSSKKVASVTDAGVIHAKAKGSCTVTVKEDGAVAKCKVKVTDK